MPARFGCGHIADGHNAMDYRCRGKRMKRCRECYNRMKNEINKRSYRKRKELAKKQQDHLTCS